MRRVIALALIAALTAGVAVPVAEAYHHGSPAVAIGTAVGFVLAAPFLIVGSLLAPLVPPYRYPPAVVESPVAVPHPAYSAPAYRAPGYAPVARPARAIALQSATGSYATTVEYPTGRYVLEGDGISVAYRWAWIPNPPPPPAADAPPPAR